MIAMVSLILALDTILYQPGRSNLSVEKGNAMESIDKMDIAAFAGGCFWGVEYAFENVPGVQKAESGFMGGKVDNPSYRQVCMGNTNHAEVVQVTFDPNQVSYRKLVEYFFKIHDPTTLNRQGPDVGTQYRSAIFYHNDQQKQIAEDVIADLKNKKVFKRPIVTQLSPAQTFWIAEDYHQNYFDKHPERAVCHPIPKFE